MEIWVEFDGGKWRISPDPAKVTRGRRVWWRFRSNYLGVRRVRWTVYFWLRNPFSVPDQFDMPPERFEISTDTALQDGQHIGLSEVLTADTPGDYKYGVRAQNLDEGKDLGDDDPHLIVL